jgi:hypothetical protein
LVPRCRKPYYLHSLSQIYLSKHVYYLRIKIGPQVKHPVIEFDIVTLGYFTCLFHNLSNLFLLLFFFSPLNSLNLVKQLITSRYLFLCEWICLSVLFMFFTCCIVTKLHPSWRIFLKQQQTHRICLKSFRE